MSRKIAIKKLRASDLSFFRAYFVRHSDVKQKALNLNANIIVKEFFPNLEAAVDASPGQRAPVTLTIFGPNGAAPHVLERKVLKQQKNWRLNGELVYDPEGDPSRYDRLHEGDLAIMEFSGASMPHAIKMVLLSATDTNDHVIHAAFSSEYTTPSMELVSEGDIQRIIREANTPAGHPITDWLDDGLLESVGAGDSEAVEKLLERRPGRGITAADLKRANERAEKAGRQGEELLNYFFQNVASPDIEECEWTASINAISPFDFKLTMKDSSIRHVDAKSTSSAFNTPLYLSTAEIRHALKSGVPYDIYRVYHVSDSTGMLRIARDIASKLVRIPAVLGALPAEVRAETLAFSPNYFDFEPTPITITFPEDDE